MTWSRISVEGLRLMQSLTCPNPSQELCAYLANDFACLRYAMPAECQWAMAEAAAVGTGVKPYA